MFEDWAASIIIIIIITIMIIMKTEIIITYEPWYENHYIFFGSETSIELIKLE